MSKINIEAYNSKVQAHNDKFKEDRTRDEVAIDEFLKALTELPEEIQIALQVASMPKTYKEAMPEVFKEAPNEAIYLKEASDLQAIIIKVETFAAQRMRDTLILIGEDPTTGGAGLSNIEEVQECSA